MPFNGAGLFTPPGTDFPAVANTLIESTKWNNVVNDIATGLSTCITKDGQTTVTADIPFANFNLDSVGDINIRSAAGVTVAGTLRSVNINGTSLADASAHIAIFSADAVGGDLAFVKSRNTAIGGHTIVQSSDDIGTITAYGSDGTDFEPAAQILLEVGGTPGNNDMPGRILFKTTPDGSTTLTTALTLDQAQGATFAAAVVVTGATTLSAHAINGIPYFSTSGLIASNASKLYFDGTAFQVTNGSGTAAGIITGNVSQAAANLHSATTSGDGIFANFGTEASFTSRGSIDYNRAGGLTRYNTTSDGDLKVLLGDAPVTDSLMLLANARPREFYWRDDPDQRPQVGFIAQELYSVFRGAVTPGGLRDVDEVYTVVEDGKDVMQRRTVKRYIPWQTDRTAFVNHLVIGWQEHQRQIAVLQARLSAAGIA